MSETTEETGPHGDEEAREEPEVAAEQPAQYVVLHSTTRSVHTRATRRQLGAVGGRRFVLRLSGGEVVVRRSRPKTVPLAFVQKNIDEVRRECAAGRLLVRTTDHKLLDLDTFAVAEEAVAPEAEVRPNFLLDDAQRDTNPIRPPTASPNAGVEPTPEALGLRKPSLLQPTAEDLASQLPPPAEEGLGDSVVEASDAPAQTEAPPEVGAPVETVEASTEEPTQKEEPAEPPPPPEVPIETAPADSKSPKSSSAKKSGKKGRK